MEYAWNMLGIGLEYEMSGLPYRSISKSPGMDHISLALDSINLTVPIHASSAEDARGSSVGLPQPPKVKRLCIRISNTAQSENSISNNFRSSLTTSCLRGFLYKAIYPKCFHFHSQNHT